MSLHQKNPTSKLPNVSPELANAYFNALVDFYKTRNNLHGIASQTDHTTVKFDPITGLHLDVTGKHVFYIAHNTKRNNGIYEALQVGIVERDRFKKVIGIRYYADIGQQIRTELNQTLASKDELKRYN